MTGVFLQVRIDSTRFPGKALLPLEDLSVIEHAMRNLKVVNADVFALLTEPSSTSQLTPLAEKWGYEVFVGDADDVLKRYADAVRHFSVTTVMRATGDNPLVSGKLANQILDHHKLKNADYSHFTGLPLGTGVGVAHAEALLTAHRLAENPYEREHVTPYLFFRDDQYKINNVPAPAEYYCPDGRVTLDTAEDYAIIKRIYHQLYQGQPIEIKALVSWLRINIPEEYYALAQ